MVKYATLFLFLLFSLNAEAQRLSFRFKGESLSAALEQVAAKAGCKIAFDPQLAKKQKVQGSYSGKTVVDVLNSLLENSGLELTRIGDVYVVKPKPEEVRDIVNEKAEVKPIESPKYKIWGAVTDVESGERLPYAYIYSEKYGISTTANADGYFALVVNNSEPFDLCISYLGFLKRCVEVTPARSSGMIYIPLDRIQTTIGGVTIQQRQNNLVMIPNVVGKSTLNPKASSDVPSINPLDFTAPLQMLPGIDGTTESAIGLNVRKSPSDQTLVLFDGFTIYHLNHFLGQLSAFNTKAIKDIQVYKGGFDARYGGAASAILEITGKSGNRYKPNFSVGADLLSADIFADVPLSPKLSVVLAARRSYTDIYQTSLYDNLFNKLRSDLAATTISSISSYKEKYSPDYSFYDIHTKISYSPDSSQDISLTVYAGNDKMLLKDTQARQSLSESNYINNKGAGLKWNRQLRTGLFLRSSVGYSEYNLDFDHQNVIKTIKNSVELARRQTQLNNSINDLTAKGELEYKLLPSVSLIAGGVYTHVQSRYNLKNYRDQLSTIEIDTLRTLNSKGDIGTGYLMTELRKGRLKLLSPGVRVTYFAPNRKLYYEPRVSAIYSLGSKVDVKAAAGRYLQFVNKIPITYLGDYNSYWVVAHGDAEPVVRANHFTAGFTVNATSRLQFDVEGYLKNTFNMSFLALQPKIDGGMLKLSQKQHYSTSRVKGVDFLAKYSYSSGQLAVAYTLSKCTVEVDKAKISPEFPSSLDQLHEVKLFASQKIWKLNLSAAWIYGSGKPWDELVLGKNFNISQGYQRNSERLSGYNRLDLSVSYDQKIGRCKLSVIGSVFNVLDSKNELRRPYSISETPVKDVLNGVSPFSYDTIYGLGVTPTVYLNLSF